MKKVFVFIILIAIGRCFAQDAQGGEDVGWIARFGAAGGFTPTIVFPNLDPINAEIKNLGISQFSNSALITYGGGGYIYIMMIDNLRIGGMGVSGSKSTSGFAGGFNNEVTYNYGFGGLTVEYTLPFIKKTAVSVGAIIGAGTASIDIYQNNNNFTWDNSWTGNSNYNSNNKSHTFTNNFFTITPTLNADIPLSRFIAIRIGGGYVFSFNNDWKIDNDQSISNVPSNLKSNSFFIQTGIYLGFFAY
jgi:hypothetical protein